MKLRVSRGGPLSWHALLLVLAAPPGGGNLRDDDRGSVLLKSDLAAPDRDAVHELVLATRARVRELLEHLGIQAKSKGVTRLRIYSRWEDFEERQKRTRPYYMHWASSFYDDASQEIVSFWGDGGFENRGTVVHEIAHQTMRESAKNAPPWFDEGFACYVQALQYDAGGDRVSSCHAFLWEAIREALQKKQSCPLDELVELLPDQFYETPSALRRPWNRQTLYAESWSLVYFLLEVPGDPQRDLLEALARQLDTGSLKRTAYAQALQDLEPAWREFLADDDFFAMDAMLLQAYRLALKGDLLASAGAAEAVLAQDPQRLAAHRLVAQASLEVGDFAGARDHFTVLMENHPAEYTVLLGLGQAALGQFRESGAAGDAAAARKAAADAVEHAAPGQEAAALLLLGDIAEATGDVRVALQCIRKLLALPGVPAAERDDLRHREQRLMAARARDPD